MPVHLDVAAFVAMELSSRKRERVIHKARNIYRNILWHFTKTFANPCTRIFPDHHSALRAVGPPQPAGFVVYFISLNKGAFWQLLERKPASQEVLWMCTQKADFSSPLRFLEVCFKINNKCRVTFLSPGGRERAMKI